MSVACYSQKILNPFRGVMNIISIGGADAVTIDGINWTLYIHDSFDCPTDDPEEFFEIEMPDIRYGDWSKESGLRHSPLIASYHYNEIQTIAHVLLDAVQQYADQCPFPFQDKYELWLLDESNDEPLALLETAHTKEQIFALENLRWEAGIRCKQEFLANAPIKDPDTKDLLDKLLQKEATGTAGDLLNHLIEQRAGQQPSAQWFYRDILNDGTGLNGININNRLIGRELSARLFPKMLVQRFWPDEAQTALFTAFIQWLSPYLLVLDHLRDEQREALELIARDQALLVDKLYIFYPKIINRQTLNAARVEATMRRANRSKASEAQDDTVEYIETQHALI
ncbi:MAG: hypothetical protein IMF14_04535 [Proteobacteria bacterium]|nr:hypothetical protein [Pseudomonadota bacterium]